MLVSIGPSDVLGPPTTTFSHSAFCSSGNIVCCPRHHHCHRCQVNLRSCHVSSPSIGFLLAWFHVQLVARVFKADFTYLPTYICLPFREHLHIFFDCLHKNDLPNNNECKTI
ncbi:hypothetical protein CEXT_89091 [Caerostris extrusa]|uniref:Uncharacterized protein n=1 Tax=Caerostris extrusa TaxID=172846 RepID=A0AAV4SYG1_CAEEX|nr:hypothetical protein CEXT_89091 [Caerostris extrusa]